MFSHPLVEYKVIANYSLLVSVKGSNTSLKPYLIASHLDVVPATNESWEVPPFEGRVQDGYFWGRGTLDVKNGVMVCAFTIKCNFWRLRDLLVRNFYSDATLERLMVYHKMLKDYSCFWWEI